MADILHLIQINAPYATVYRTIATAEGVRNWLSRDADFDSTAGSHGEIRFAEGKRILKIEIEELRPTMRVVWKVLSAAVPTRPDTKIEFETRAENDGTMLHFAHRGFQQTDDLFAMSSTIWASFLISLKQYSETGQGTPHPDDALSRASGSR